MGFQIVILVVLLSLSAFFSASETALVSLSPAKVRDLVRKKKKGALLVEQIKSHPHKLLITILIGNNLVNVLASVYATIIFENILGSAALGIITGILTFVILVFGEIAPKLFAQNHAKALSRYVAPFLYIFFVIFTPAVWLLDSFIKIMFLTTGKTKHENHVTEDELKAFVDIGAEEGAIQKDEQELIENVLEFSDTRVEEIMAPRVGIQALPLSSTIKEASDFVVKHHHSRIPVYDKNIDDIVGMITVKEILGRIHTEEMNKTLGSLNLLKPLKVPASKKINQLFHEFQKRRMHLAIVLDEHGGTAGLITLEDILEEIVGEIVDEFDEEEKPDLRKIGKSEVEATGKTLIEEINDALEIQIPAPEHKTISYYITEKLGRFPKRGEIIDDENFVTTIDEMNKHTIEKVTIERKEISLDS
ncbi:MAG: transporter [Candidatus Peregrinibacteria bacterium GW2011_GWF2_39_17]|nr:MAG: transporter [Candidatus Peregrinibacteria bacterium GW2011_GWF2_39_17]HCW32360.1 hemolysin [Candidatus Peregrinibacteria bacterium]